MPKISAYIREVSQEIKKVTWPTRQQTQDKTVLVIVISLAVGAYIGLLDYFFSQLMAAII
jgi:preprotein translocase subunit SecE